MKLNEFAALLFSLLHGSDGRVLLGLKIGHCADIILPGAAIADRPARCKHLLLLQQKLLLKNRGVLLMVVVIVGDELLQLVQSRRIAARETQSILLVTGLERRVLADDVLLRLWLMLENLLLHLM